MKNYIFSKCYSSRSTLWFARIIRYLAPEFRRGIFYSKMSLPHYWCWQSTWLFPIKNCLSFLVLNFWLMCHYKKMWYIGIISFSMNSQFWRSWRLVEILLLIAIFVKGTSPMHHFTYLYWLSNNRFFISRFPESSFNLKRSRTPPCVPVQALFTMYFSLSLSIIAKIHVFHTRPVSQSLASVIVICRRLALNLGYCSHYLSGTLTSVKSVFLITYHLYDLPLLSLLQQRVCIQGKI